MFFNMSTLKKKTCWTAKWQSKGLKSAWILGSMMWKPTSKTLVVSDDFNAGCKDSHTACLIIYVLSVVHVLDYVPFWGRLEKGASTERSADFDDHLWLGGLGLWLNITKFYGFNQGSWFVTRFSSRHNQGWPPKKRTRDVKGWLTWTPMVPMVPHNVMVAFWLINRATLKITGFEWKLGFQPRKMARSVLIY